MHALRRDKDAGADDTSDDDHDTVEKGEPRLESHTLVIGLCILKFQYVYLFSKIKIQNISVEIRKILLHTCSCSQLLHVLKYQRIF